MSPPPPQRDWPGGVRTCGAGFIPASAGGAAALAWVAAPSAGIKPAPQKSKQDVPAAAAAKLVRWGENLWGRVYPGQRGWGRCLGVGRGSVGRREAGPTKGRCLFPTKKAPLLVARQEPRRLPLGADRRPGQALDGFVQHLQGFMGF